MDSRPGVVWSGRPPGPATADSAGTALLPQRPCWQPRRWPARALTSHPGWSIWPWPRVLMRPGLASPTAMVATPALYEGVVACTVVLVFPATEYGTMALIWLGPA